MATIKGQNLRLFMENGSGHYSAIAAAQSCNLSVRLSVKQISTKDDILFAYDEFEKAEILKKLEGKKYTLQRSKGLGENEPDMMWKTTMNPETRRLIAVTPTDAVRTYEIFDTLLGDNLPARKEFITAHGHEYIKDADI